MHIGSFFFKGIIDYFFPMSFHLFILQIIILVPGILISDKDRVGIINTALDCTEHIIECRDR